MRCRLFKCIISQDIAFFDGMRTGDLMRRPTLALPLTPPQEREALETAFWEACAQELDASPPVFERTLQLLHEMCAGGVVGVVVLVVVLVVVEK